MFQKNKVNIQIRWIIEDPSLHVRNLTMGTLSKKYKKELAACKNA